jgi:hypothetical protein
MAGKIRQWLTAMLVKAGGERGRTTVLAVLRPERSTWGSLSDELVEKRTVLRRDKCQPARETRTATRVKMM